MVVAVWLDRLYRQQHGSLQNPRRQHVEQFANGNEIPGIPSNGGNIGRLSAPAICLAVVHTCSRAAGGAGNAQAGGGGRPSSSAETGAKIDAQSRQVPDGIRFSDGPGGIGSFFGGD